MKKTFCDRCGQDILGASGIHFEANAIISDMFDSIDLCRNCWKEFITWIKEPHIPK